MIRVGNKLLLENLTIWLKHGSCTCLNSWTITKVFGKMELLKISC